MPTILNQRPGPGNPFWRYQPIHSGDPIPHAPLGSIAPFFLAAGTLQTSTGAALSIPWPYPFEKDDFALLIHESSGENVLSATIDLTSQGWTALDAASDTFDTTGSTVTTWWKRAENASEPDAITDAQTDHQVGRIYVFRNVWNTGEPINTRQLAIKPTSSSTATTPDITTTHDKQLCVIIASRPNDSAATNHFGNPTGTTLTGIAKLEFGTTDGNGGGFSVAWGVKATAGAVGSATQSKGVSTTDITLIYALSPENESVTPPTLVQYWGILLR